MSSAPTDEQSQQLRKLPAISALVQSPVCGALGVPDRLAAELSRQAVAHVRQAIVAGDLAGDAPVDQLVIQELSRRATALMRPSLGPLLNGSGVLLHTNAGRAPLPPSAVAAMHTTLQGYNTLELDTVTGKRGSRQSHCRPLLCWLSGAQDALVVNNGAAAVLLAVRALAHGRPVVVSRSQIVEIGGGFRVNEVIATAGCRLIEVGTTNRTHLRDYTSTLEQLQQQGDPAALILQVHRSNFALVGFCSEPPLAQIVEIGRTYGVHTVVDLGSGALQPLAIAPAQWPDGTPSPLEPTVAEVVAQGPTIVTFSGDKLLGGPQAGICVGQAAQLAVLARDPLARAVRVGGAVLAGLHEVLRLHAMGLGADLPALGQLSTAESEITAQATRWADQLASLLAGFATVEVVATVTQVGGGTHPLLILPSRALAITAFGMTATELAERALAGTPALLGRAKGNQFLVDVRTLLAGSADGGPTGVPIQLARALGVDQR